MQKSLTQLVISAQSGDKDSLEIIIQRFMPLLLKYSRNAKMEIDEDCMQYLITKVIEAVKRFKLQ